MAVAVEREESASVELRDAVWAAEEEEEELG